MRAHVTLLTMALALACGAPLCSGVWNDGFVVDPNRAPCVGSYWACNVASTDAPEPLPPFEKLPCGQVFCARSGAEATAAAVAYLGEYTTPPGLQCGYLGETLMGSAISGNEEVFASWNGTCVERKGDPACKHAWEPCTAPALFSTDRQSDCCPGLTCDDLDYEHYVCCVAKGQSCSATSECCGTTYNRTIECVLGICENTCLFGVGPGLDGDPCTTNHDCVSCVCDEIRGCSGDY